MGQFKGTLMSPNLHHGVSEGSSFCHVFRQDGLDDDGVGVDDGDVLVRPGPLVLVDLCIQITNLGISQAYVEARNPY